MVIKRRPSRELDASCVFESSHGDGFDDRFDDDTMSPRLRTAHMTGVSRTRERARSYPEDGVDALRETLRAFEKVSSARSGVRFFSHRVTHREARARRRFEATDD